MIPLLSSLLCFLGNFFFFLPKTRYHRIHYRMLLSFKKLRRIFDLDKVDGTFERSSVYLYLLHSANLLRSRCLISRQFMVSPEKYFLLQRMHNMISQKRKTSFCTDCTGFPAGYRTMFFKKQRIQNKRRSKNSPNSHTKRMHWLAAVLTRF